MSESDLSFIGISERAYKYIRQFTIKSVDDALVELITNCVDAYNKTTQENRPIEICVIDETNVIVRDRALGLSSEQLSKCFLQVGNYTAEDTSRGFFSRGAKDISALGDIYFNTIKDGKYSQCLLNMDAHGMIKIADIDATPEIREQLNLPGESNGLEVTINLLPNYQNINIDTLYNSLCNLGVLRDIVSDSRNTIILKKYTGSGNLIYTKQVKYIYPQGSLVLDLIYNVPNYEDKQARFVVYRVDEPLPQPLKESELQFGFLWKDSTTIYEVNTINDRFRWNPYINHLYGYISCEGIKTFLHEYDVSGPSLENPYPIIDPSRLTGINKMHPFISSLLSIPLTRIDLILRELNGQIATKSVTIEDIDQLLDELSKYGIDVLETEDIEVKFIPDYDSQLIKGINNDRGLYVTYEQSYTMNGNYLTEEVEVENYIKEEIIRLEDLCTGDCDNYYFVDSLGNLVQIQTRDTDQINDPVDILDLIPTENLEDIRVRPYIYKLSQSSRDVMKLYVFQKGKFENPENILEKNILSKNKQFRIEFINDLNSVSRYIIDNTNGIQIKLNLNNPIISKYLTARSIEDMPSTIELSKLSSTRSLMFFKELMTDILATVIVEHDVENGKIITDGTTYTNIKKINEHYNKIVSKIEVPINNIMNKYIMNNIAKKVESINVTVSDIKGRLMQSIQQYPDLLDELGPLESSMKTIINNLIE